MKLSYNYMSNMSSDIKQRNLKVISTKNEDRLCNCRNKDRYRLFMINN